MARRNSLKSMLAYAAMVIATAMFASSCTEDSLAVFETETFSKEEEKVSRDTTVTVMVTGDNQTTIVWNEILNGEIENTEEYIRTVDGLVDCGDTIVTDNMTPIKFSELKKVSSKRLETKDSCVYNASWNVASRDVITTLQVKIPFERANGETHIATLEEEGILEIADTTTVDNSTDYHKIMTTSAAFRLHIGEYTFGRDTLVIVQKKATDNAYSVTSGHKETYNLVLSGQELSWSTLHWAKATAKGKADVEGEYDVNNLFEIILHNVSAEFFSSLENQPSTWEDDKFIIAGQTAIELRLKETKVEEFKAGEQPFGKSDLTYCTVNLSEATAKSGKVENGKLPVTITLKNSCGQSRSITVYLGATETHVPNYTVKSDHKETYNLVLSGQELSWSTLHWAKATATGRPTVDGDYDVKNLFNIVLNNVSAEYFSLLENQPSTWEDDKFIIAGQTAIELSFKETKVEEFKAGEQTFGKADLTYCRVDLKDATARSGKVEDGKLPVTITLKNSCGQSRSITIYLSATETHVPVSGNGHSDKAIPFQNQNDSTYAFVYKTIDGVKDESSVKKVTSLMTTSLEVLKSIELPWSESAPSNPTISSTLNKGNFKVNFTNGVQELYAQYPEQASFVYPWINESFTLNIEGKWSVELAEGVTLVSDVTENNVRTKTYSVKFNLVVSGVDEKGNNFKYVTATATGYVFMKNVEDYIIATTFDHTGGDDKTFYFSYHEKHSQIQTQPKELKAPSGLKVITTVIKSFNATPEEQAVTATPDNVQWTKTGNGISEDGVSYNIYQKVVPFRNADGKVAYEVTYEKYSDYSYAGLTASMPEDAAIAKSANLVEVDGNKSNADVISVDYKATHKISRYTASAEADQMVNLYSKVTKSLVEGMEVVEMTTVDRYTNDLTHWFDTVTNVILKEKSTGKFFHGLVAEGALISSLTEINGYNGSLGWAAMRWVEGTTFVPAYIPTEFISGAGNQEIAKWYYCDYANKAINQCVLGLNTTTHSKLRNPLREVATKETTADGTIAFKIGGHLYK